MPTIDMGSRAIRPDAENCSAPGTRRIAAYGLRDARPSGDGTATGGVVGSGDGDEPTSSGLVGSWFCWGEGS
ncbi:hypothetical protein GCM10023221_23880 [Luteimicrobium xylanilyticum]